MIKTFIWYDFLKYIIFYFKTWGIDGSVDDWPVLDNWTVRQPVGWLDGCLCGWLNGSLVLLWLAEWFIGSFAFGWLDGWLAGTLSILLLKVLSEGLHFWKNWTFCWFFNRVAMSVYECMCPIPMPFFSRPLIGPQITWSVPIILDQIDFFNN